MILKARARPSAILGFLAVVPLSVRTNLPPAAPARSSWPPRLPFVTRVEGPSNFHRLGVPFEASAMGRTGILGPPPGSRDDAPFAPEATLIQSASLTGADLYRLGCQSCHQSDGGGLPPEINALLGPVQATSAVVMERRMKERGRPITPAFARELATGSKKDLLDRLHKGGQKMPSFGYLAGQEVDALVQHLELLAGMAPAGRQLPVAEPSLRVGELLVKGTCHICHDATGRWPDHEALLQGSVPPISGFTTEKTMLDFVRKVRHGAPVVMGSPPLTYRGRMPVFDYLSDDAVKSAYVYLVTYPP